MIVSVIVPHYNDLTRLSSCLSALMRQKTRYAYEVIVADNNSRCTEEELLRAVDGRASLLVVKTPGAGPARNGGVTAARGEVIALTDADCLPADDWLQNGVDALLHARGLPGTGRRDGSRDATADIVGGNVAITPPAESGEMDGYEAIERVFGFDNRSYVEQKSFSVTANLFTRKRVFDEVGGFRAGLSEDVDWCRRAVAAGFRLGYSDDSVVQHPPRIGRDQHIGKWLRIEREMFALHWSGGGSRAYWLARAFGLIGVTPLRALRLLREPKLPLRARRDGALGMLGLSLYRARRSVVELSRSRASLMTQIGNEAAQTAPIVLRTGSVIAPDGGGTTILAARDDETKGKVV